MACDSTKITVFRKNDITLTVTFTDKVTGDPIDITGWTIRFTVKLSRMMNKDTDDTDANAIIKKDITAFAAPTTGVAEVPLSDSDLDQDAKTYFYDFKSLDDLSNDLTLLTGEFVILQGVTNR